MMGPRLGILADDLTGACDAAAPFAARGFESWVAWDIENLANSSAEIISASSNSRSDPPHLAAEKSCQFARRMLESGAGRVFKKVDSTLRGNWATEVLAVLSELRLASAVIAPAFPEMGRTIIDGRLHLRGKPDADLVTLAVGAFNEKAKCVCHISLRDLRNGSVNLTKLISQRCDQVSLFAIDGESDADLDIVAESVEALRESILPVGSAGLATSIARRLKSLSGPKHVHASTRTREPAGGPTSFRYRPPIILLFVGSCNLSTDAQVKVLRETKTVCEIELDEGSHTHIRECLQRRMHTIVRVRQNQSSTLALKRLLEACRGGEAVSFVLTGGDTAQFVCDSCAAHGIWIGGEISPGVPYGWMSGELFDRVCVATKAGGFGTPELLVEIVSFLEGGGESHVGH